MISNIAIRQAANRTHRDTAATLTAERAAAELHTIANDTRAQGGPCADDDADSLELLAEALNEGISLEAVFGDAQRLETGCRELIPSPVWLFLGGELVYGFGDE